MSIAKDEATARLDLFSDLASETLELYERLQQDIADESARTTLGAHVAEQRRLLRAINEARRARGGLPQQGDPERAQLRALYTRIAAIASCGDARILESLIDVTTDLRARAQEALELDLPADHSGPLAAFESDCDALIGSLRNTLTG